MSAGILWVKSSSVRGGYLLSSFALIVIGGLFGACCPLPHGSYYKPSYPDPYETFPKTTMLISEGPPSSAKITIPSGDMLVDLRKHHHTGQIELHIALQASDRSTLQFSSNVIRLTDMDNDTQFTMKAKDLELQYLSGMIPYSSVVNFDDFLPAAPEYVLNDMEVWIPFSIKGFSPDVVRLYLPPIAANSEEYKIPPIILSADKESEESRKWGWWPYKWTDVKVKRFTVHGGATGGMHGGSKIDARLKEPELHSNIMIAFPANTKWKFVSNEVRIEDASSGEVRQVQFPHVLVQSTVRVAFTAPFKGYGSLDQEIGKVQPKALRVELPPLLINGEEFIIKPITFKLRRFDFGLYPLL